MSKAESTFSLQRCLNEVTGHKSEILGVLKLTSISEAPEIFLMTFAQGEESIYLTGVDDRNISQIVTNRAICLDYPRQGRNTVQICNASPYEGVDFSLLEKDKINGGHLISFWTFK